MTYLPPDPNNQITPIPVRPDRDPNEWKDEPGKRGRLPISTTQFFAGLILLAIGATVAAFLLRPSGGAAGLDVEILSPEDGSAHAPGLVVLRVRVDGGERSPVWELNYRRVADGGEWTPIANGSGDVVPSGRVGGNGLQMLEIDDAGVYELQLKVNDATGGEQVTRSVQFSVTE